MSGKRKKVVMIVTVVIVGLLLVAFFIWGELSWSAHQSEITASTQDQSSTSQSTSQQTAASSTAVDTGKSVFSDATVEASSGASSSRDVNDPGDGVARDTTSQAKSTDSQGRVVAEVQLTWWDAGGTGISVNGAVNNIVESGGTCTLTAVKNPVTRIVMHASQVNATTTACGELSIPSSQLGSGDWVITLSYSSKTAYGVSSPQTVHIS
ncbi:hypothetical protein [Bifidobacterium sp.]|jgi:cytoskeletal protein RodZ|uniref:hypothetical protein n=1 Tax=Bifidobacterium sp. TaxID=41200 RepID=UPI0025BABFB2|nr:hypothetical protein [Bifidobacterium sp.]MCI1636420.1 hypothetical protein [Bifidobacterium sp.]